MSLLPLFHRRPSLVAEVVPPDLIPLFLYYRARPRRSRIPAAVQGRLIQQFGAEHARKLIALFEKSAIPARPTEWRRRMH